MKYNWEEIFKKLKEGTSYQDITEEYGMAYATLVRKWKAYTAGELATREMNYDKDTLEALAKKELRILTEQKKNTFIRKEAQKLTRETAITELLLEAIDKKDIAPIKVTKYKPIKESKGEMSHQTFVISDLHYVDWRRSKSLRLMGKMLLDNWDGSKNVSIVFNGDLIENTHHLEQLLDRGNAMTQSIEVADIIADSIAMFLNRTPEDVGVTLYFVLGNHDEIRQLGTKAGETKKINIVPVVMKVVGERLKNFNVYETNSEGHEIPEKIRVSLFGDFTQLDLSYTLDWETGENKTINIRHGHQFKSNIQQNIEKSLIKEAVQGNGFDSIYVISHFHQFRHWIMKGSDIGFGENIMVVMTPSMKDWNGEFENWNMTRNTSGMISIDEKKNVKYIPIPYEKEDY